MEESNDFYVLDSGKIARNGLILPANFALHTDGSRLLVVSNPVPCLVSMALAPAIPRSRSTI